MTCNIPMNSLTVGTTTYLATPTSYQNATLTIDFTSNTLYPDFLVCALQINTSCFLKRNWFQITVALFNPYTQMYQVLPNWNGVYTPIASAYISLTGLIPGRCLSVNAIPYINPTVQSTAVCLSANDCYMAITSYHRSRTTTRLWLSRVAVPRPICTNWHRQSPLACRKTLPSARCAVKPFV